jgi:hypothetical protein
MSSDAEYATLLQKANRSYAPTGEDAQVQDTLQTQEIPDDELHPAVKAVTNSGRMYVSDADEAFVTVQAEWAEKRLPDSGLSHLPLTLPFPPQR